MKIKSSEYYAYFFQNHEGEHWIVASSETDFNSLFDQFDRTIPIISASSKEELEFKMSIQNLSLGELIDPYELGGRTYYVEKEGN